MLCDRIMDLSRFTLVAIIGIFLSGVPEATSWGSNELNRNDGYDLQRGPVFYEAYYPDDQQGPSAIDEQRNIINNPQTARRYFDRANVLEKTYQAIQDSQKIFSQERNSRQELMPINYNAPIVPIESFRSNQQDSRNSQVSDQAYEVARQLKRFVEGLEQDSNSQDYRNPRNINEPRINYDNAGRNFHARNPYLLQKDYEKIYPNEQIQLNRKLDDYVNLILSAVKNEALEISKAKFRDEAISDNSENIRVSRQQRFVETEDSFDQPQRKITDVHENFNNFGRSVKSGSELQLHETELQDKGHFSDKRQYFGDEYQDVKGPVSQMKFSHMENIFQPRPQVINYVFSPSRTKAISTSTDEKNIKKERSGNLNDENLRNGDNLVVDETKKKVEKSDGLGIASIEVSEMPRHKIRHHHGEKPRRYNHRNFTEKVKH